MKVIKKILLFSLVIFVFITTAQSGYCKTVKKEIEVQTKDARLIKAELSYVKIEGIKKYPTVVLLHSIGYSSADWGNLVQYLNNAGYAVLAIDLRGHGKSVYNAKFKKLSWQYFSTKTYQNFPNDVMAILKETQKQSKLVSMNNLAIVGADVGANTAILVSKELKIKPKALVLICPTTTFKGLYTPIALAEMGRIPVLSMVSTQDGYSMKEQKELSKFAQGGFYAKNYPNGGMGMIMIKVNPNMTLDITKWLLKYVR
jgi:pimeloyl-ACP methyl ester carboxylesterase